MWIVAVAWIYVVGLMALTETSVVAGIMTFLFYCVLPLSILYYLSGSKARRLRNEAAMRERMRQMAAAEAEGSTPGADTPTQPGPEPK
ncbi:hypothetical protein [Massilia sp. TWR1-2-2]|uniref:hypothetical protein n=1 Tax=Massilia sp. TWR1-2-2 TaxID=2804584 RepID=UPI003CFB5DC9